MQVYAIIATVAIALLRPIESVALEGACDTDAECQADTADSHCEPAVSPSCNKGSCECQPHYAMDNAKTKCSLRRYYGDSCTSDQVCMQGTSCLSGRCQCSATNTHSDVLHTCINSLTLLASIGQPCNDVTECFTDPSLPGSVECKVLPGRTVTFKQCWCADGYIQQSYMCRKPYHGELCYSSVGCASQHPSLPATEASFSEEVCTNSRCACPDNHNARTIRIDGTNMDFCIQEYTGTIKTYGQTCTSTNECGLNLCFKCPEASGNTCMLNPI